MMENIRIIIIFFFYIDFRFYIYCIFYYIYILFFHIYYILCIQILKYFESVGKHDSFVMLYESGWAVKSSSGEKLLLFRFFVTILRLVKAFSELWVM